MEEPTCRVKETGRGATSGKQRERAPDLTTEPGAAKSSGNRTPLMGDPRGAAGGRCGDQGHTALG